ncbi:hypothetical protein Vretifemale_217, partial [Volvox reticuliferus]
TAISPPTPRPSPSPLPPTPLYGLRLVGGNSSSEGRVEIFNGTVWGTVCDDGFGNTEANVVCRELGYASGEGVQMWGGGTGPILMDNVYCSIYPSPSRLYQCSFNGWGIHNCGHYEDVGVRCFSEGSVHTFWSHTCVLSTQGSIKCFGLNNYGQLGRPYGVSGNFPNYSSAPTTVDLGPGLYASSVVTGAEFTCALLQPGGIVKCWGINEDGQLGLGDTMGRGVRPGEMGAALPAVDLGPGLTATEIAAGAQHACAILQPGGRVKCWGYNYIGELGLGDRYPRGDFPGQMGENLPFVDLGTGLHATALAAGSAFTCALLQPGHIVKCWGYNEVGQLGQGDTENRGVRPGQMGDALPAVDLGPAYNATALIAGIDRVCAILQPVGVIKCWGSNDCGALGLGDTRARGTAPGQMGASLRRVDLGPGVAVTAVSTTYCRSCAVLQPGGVLKCWGQLGNDIRGDQPNEMGASLPAVDLGPGASAVAVTMGLTVSCVLVQPGNVVKCWSTGENSPMPIAVNL